MKKSNFLKIGVSTLAILINLSMGADAMDGPQGGRFAAAISRVDQLLGYAQRAALAGNGNAVQANLGHIVGLMQDFPGCAAHVQEQINLLRAQHGGSVDGYRNPVQSTSQIVPQERAPVQVIARDPILPVLQQQGVVLPQSQQQQQQPSLLPIQVRQPQPNAGDQLSLKQKYAQALLYASNPIPFAEQQIQPHLLQSPIVVNYIFESMRNQIDAYNREVRNALAHEAESHAYVQNRVELPNLLDTLQKTTTFLIGFSGVFPTLQQCVGVNTHMTYGDVFSFALRVNRERFGNQQPIDLSKKIGHVARGYQILSILDGNYKRDLEYNAAIPSRDQLYEYMISLNRIFDDFTRSADYDLSLRELCGVFRKLPNQKFELMEGETFSSAKLIQEFSRHFREDLDAVTADFQLKRAVFIGQLDDARNHYNYLTPSEYHTIWTQAQLQIGTFDTLHARDPIRLTYANLTYNDRLAVLFAQNWAYVTDETMNAMMVDMCELYPNYILRDGGNRDYFPVSPEELDILRLNLQKRLDINDGYHGIPRVRDAKEGRGVNAVHTQNWAERIHYIYTRVPPTLVGQGNILNLAQAKRLVTEHILGVFQGCGNGINQKLPILEALFQHALGRFDCHTRILQPVAAIVHYLKDQHLSALELSCANNERRTSTQLLARQELNVPLSLLCPYIGTGGSESRALHNRPPAILNRMFDPLAQRNGDNLGPTSVITVRSLVEAVYNEFDRSISCDVLSQFVYGHFDMYKDLVNHPTNNLENGIFCRYRANHEPRNAKNYYLRTTAFRILEEVGYIQIAPEVKALVYNWDERTDHPGTYYNPQHGRHMSLDELIDRY